MRRVECRLVRSVCLANYGAKSCEQRLGQAFRGRCRGQSGGTRAQNYILARTSEITRRPTTALADGTRLPDLFALGPEVPVNDAVRRRFFGEE